ncbi:SDR family NAD(P)-dependent oxidoreductase [Natrinema sp. 1APR25-10V2]|uniref:SDR family NAD(P)-dependent oxidoreductase n=1 Tax=Natrinema sp. 1APR25-10V2 TaxID=2951081 RepID=UPI0028741974|nr:SDR family NAD(P)-dependent oxidoreductase [Natrinema sp. 1APR25-10V2]MDS0476952.1 SDR family NAD(P)-dependent oxidoreductase [Natrinema sp. 1APR25-10V2]
MISLDNRTVLITGGGRGIGREACLQFAERGANVVVNDVGGDPSGEGHDQRPADTVVEMIESAGGTAVADYSDVGTWNGAQQAVETALDAFGDLDVIYNNAGILRENSLVNMTETEFDEVIRVHLKGTFSVLHHAAAYWREQSKDGIDRERTVVNASSDIATGGFGLGNYAAAKAGILGLTRTAAEELAQYGVRVNAIWPVADTRLTEEWPENLPGPEASASMVVFLASPDCEVTGQTIRIGGDRIDLVTPAPKYEYTVVADNEWSPEEISERFADTVGENIDQRIE